MAIRFWGPAICGFAIVWFRVSPMRPGVPYQGGIDQYWLSVHLFRRVAEERAKHEGINMSLSSNIERVSGKLATTGRAIAAVPNRLGYRAQSSAK
ncbi:hypothetical protein SAMD00023353_1501300 [Rosellinia necatrix]|uniref:Uncharacterized protein n=1 Tax=Rosellinia necatrix TaxID=77044 RepID=A0A1S8A7E8_ROSNE|nr:hypothetical protein SAMD00023353_1501300 [Rosellinia necatrix]